MDARPDLDTSAALREAAASLALDPAAAAQLAGRVLELKPESVDAKRLVAASHRIMGDAAKALEIIEPLAAGNEGDSASRYEYALCLGAFGKGAEAIEVLRSIVAAEPSHADAWRSLGDQLYAAGDDAGSREAYERHLRLSTRHPELIEAAGHLAARSLNKAESIARSVLRKDPLDVVAMRMLAGIGIEVGQVDDAVHLLERCLELAPHFHLARQNYATALARRQRYDEAIAETDRLLTAEPMNPQYRMIRASFLVQKGDHDAALEAYEELLASYPNQSNAHMNFAHTLKSVGRLDDAVRSYRRAIDLRPAAGEVYWSLANLKTFRFDDAEIDAMRAQVVDDDSADPDDQAHLSFALGKALEDRGEFEESFRHYARGNRIRGAAHRHSAKINVFNTARQMKTLTEAFFAGRKGWGSGAADPIFVVGLPRAGSTLLEQILASHSLVQGTAELPDIIAISRRLGARSRKNPAGRYPEVLTTLTEEQALSLGDGYIESTRVQRRGEPFFIDKMPNNFQHIGLIHLILPNAKIIDARRHPMAGCFSCFKQLFARGQTFTYDFADLGHYYRDYVALMDHWDRVLPGRVHRVQYENMISDTENEIRRLLDYCGLPFEDACLRFYETERAVRTPSAQQVRRPVYTEGVEQWRHFEPWLDPLKQALGPLLERYPIE